MDHVDYETFKKMDIRVGTVVAAELVPETDKLIKCVIDFGDLGERTIVSGIAQWYPDPQELVGKQNVYIVNLEPRTIRGVESQGMLLALSHGDDDFALLHPSETVPPGSRIS